MVSDQEAAGRLAAAGWLKRAATQRILALLDGAGGRTRAVGGIVRDTILGRERDTNDIDLATELLPLEVTARAEAAGIAAYPTGIEHGTVTLRLGDQVAEVTTLRQDIETDGRRAVVQFGTDWTRDAERRDFTLNALYCDTNGVLFDPLGGLDDCLAGWVRFIGNPDQRIAEDRLRVYRFFRFSASHGEQRLDPDGLAACGRAAGELEALSAERVGAEMKRMLALPKVAATLRAMGQAGVLNFNRGQRVYDAFEAIEQIEPGVSAFQRLAVIVLFATPLDDLKQMWRLSKAEVTHVSQILGAANTLTAGDIVAACYVYPDTIQEAVVVAGVHEGWTAERVADMKARIVAIKVPPFPVNGDDLLAAGYGANRELRDEIVRLEGLWIKSHFTLSRDDLLGAIRPASSER